jgi:D-amino-acid dehydrogenase
MVIGLEADGDRIAQALTDKRAFKADAFVLALGAESPILARKLGFQLPIYPIKGYSFTIPIENRLSPPAIASVDEHNLVAVSCFGDRIRVTATAEFAGYDTSHKPSDFAFMKSVTQDLFPDGADYYRAEMWAGLRPMTPNNLPFFGRRRFRNLSSTRDMATSAGRCPTARPESPRTSSPGAPRRYPWTGS